MGNSSTLLSLRRRLNRPVGPEGVNVEPMRPTPGFCAESLADRTGGRWLADLDQPVLLVEESLPLQFRHGPHELAHYLEQDSRSLGDLAGSAPLDPRASLFIDTETTGLSGGAGTYAFLVGIGLFRNDTFVLRQYFLPNPGCERVFLKALLPTFEEQPCGQLVSFNGKSYDLSLLNTRCLLHRLDRPWLKLGHLDLLHPARSFWKHQFSDCSLQTLERRVLGLSRDSDVPSSQIPGRYFSFLRSGSFPLLPLILRHNRWDLLSLVSLCTVMALAVRDPSLAPQVDPNRTALLLERRGRLEQAALLLEAAGAAEGEWQQRLQLAGVRKRLGHTRRAFALFSSTINHHPRAVPREAFEEAAKLLEHQRHDLSGALELVDQALVRFPGCRELATRRHRLVCRIEGRRWY